MLVQAAGRIARAVLIPCQAGCLCLALHLRVSPPRSLLLQVRALTSVPLGSPRTVAVMSRAFRSTLEAGRQHGGGDAVQERSVQKADG